VDGDVLGSFSVAVFLSQTLDAAKLGILWTNRCSFTDFVFFKLNL
jgi:hypothetical protein